MIKGVSSMMGVRHPRWSNFTSLGVRHDSSRLYRYTTIPPRRIASFFLAVYFNCATTQAVRLSHSSERIRRTYDSTSPCHLFDVTVLIQTGSSASLDNISTIYIACTSILLLAMDGVSRWNESHLMETQLHEDLVVRAVAFPCAQ